MNDTFNHQGMTFCLTLETEDFHRRKPWIEDDGHGPVSDWRRTDYLSRPTKAPGERILFRDGRSFRTYDFAEAVRIARRDGWDAPPYKTGTKGQQAARAAEADFNRLRQWCEGQWWYVGVVVELLDDEGEPTGETASLWGIESDADNYIAEVGQDLAGEIVDRLRSCAAAA